ncbi:MAG: malate synthase G [Sulfurospirillum sp.]|nr:malate synthase G [Sulfurospirillum sp.]
MRVGKLEIASELYTFIDTQVLDGLDFNSEQIWEGFADILTKLGAKNQELVSKRDVLQQKLDAFYSSLKGKEFDAKAQKEFLQSIGYLENICEDFMICTANVDDEISQIAAPQLVVPADNARYVLNAANARWGSLFDVLYGTDVIEQTPPFNTTNSYNPKRGEKVFAFCFAFLDEIAPLQKGSFSDVIKIELVDNTPVFSLQNGTQTRLEDGSIFAGYQKKDTQLSSLLFKHHSLHVILVLDKTSSIGAQNALGLSDVMLEAALSAIVDCEDSVACVDVNDKVKIYRNWLGLMLGDLQSTFTNRDKVIHRKLNDDKHFYAPNASELCLSGRVLLLNRNVGIHMYTDIVQYDGASIPEGFLDAFVVTLCALHDLSSKKKLKNSTKGSVYIIKPKCHGSEEVAFVCELFDAIEQLLGLKQFTIKMGIMDEERRTSVNLKNTIEKAKERVFFINTGFLDRTGDEIHSIMQLGAVMPKEEIKKEQWLQGYEDQNIDVGLHVGFFGIAQVGKGMWTMPDLMHDMIKTKIAHPLSGANTAWVPSPTAAVLHALHYHKVDVKALQLMMQKTPRQSLDAILNPAMLRTKLSTQEIQDEITNNIQSILGYVVRWVDQGIGCSKVPDINDVALMEDRATLRISSQHVANWLYHSIVTHEQVLQTLQAMAKVVDAQNAGDPNYKNMASNFDESLAFTAACDLVFEGAKQPNGYTEFILHKRRLQAKARYM